MRKFVTQFARNVQVESGNVGGTGENLVTVLRVAFRAGQESRGL
jgi:hypothetical protein